MTERLGFEGPLDNDTTRPCNDAATRTLAGVDPSRMPDALEGWRRALVESAPGDAVCLDARLAIGVGRAVRAAIAPAHVAEFAQRFEGLAAAALEEAGYDDAALGRVEHENPYTQSGVLASLRRFDLAFERGARAAARARLEQARANLVPHRDVPRDAALRAAISARRLALGDAPRRSGSADASALDRASGLRLAARVVLDPQGSDDPAWHLRPAGAFDSRGRVWIQTGETLVLLDDDLSPQRFVPRDLCLALGARWLPAFGVAELPWLQRPAIEPQFSASPGAGPDDADRAERLALVLGRAKEARGNALCVLDVRGAAPRVTWVFSETGLARARTSALSAGTMDAPEPAEFLPGRLEFQPGPLFCDGLLIAQVLQWHQPGERPSAQHVEAAKTAAWLVAFDAADGSVAWKRLLCAGADRRARSASRFAGERGISSQSLPLELADGEIMAATELGLFARIAAYDGSLIAAWRTRRTRATTAAQPGRGGPFVVTDAEGHGSFALCSADSGGVAYVDGADGLPPRSVRIDGLVRLVGASAGVTAVLVEDHGRRFLDRIHTESGVRERSVAVPRGAEWQGAVSSTGAVMAAYEGRAVLFDLRREIRLAAAVDLAGLEEEHALGLLVRGERAYVLGTRRAWVIELH